ncbi:hypothetical protein AB7Z98_15220 [Providencia manganoxydans]|uniref:hypothetical protein n=1 Tax=Providencia manganoxydans TaxID=2923283 RepID=UPI0034E5C741
MEHAKRIFSQRWESAVCWQKSDSLADAPARVAGGYNQYLYPERHRMGRKGQCLKTRLCHRHCGRRTFEPQLPPDSGIRQT